VLDRGSNGYNTIAPSYPNWNPSALVSISVQRVWVMNAGPLINLPVQSASAGTSPSRDAQEVVITRRSNSTSHSPLGENFGWPVGGDACCVT